MASKPGLRASKHEGSGSQTTPTSFNSQVGPGLLTFNPGGSLPLWTNSPYGNSIIFNGTNQTFLQFTTDVTLPSGGSVRSIFFIMSTTDADAGFHPMLHYGTASVGNAVYIYKHGAFLDVDSYGSNFDGAITINDGNWHVVGFTTDGTTTRLYVDGVADTTSAQTFNTISSGNFFLARDVNGRYFNGTIAGVGIWNRVLSSDEVNLLNYDFFNIFRYNPRLISPTGKTLLGQIWM